MIVGPDGSGPDIRTGVFKTHWLATVAVPTRTMMIGRMVQGRTSRLAHSKPASLNVPRRIVMHGRMRFSAGYQDGRVRSPLACKSCSADADHDDWADGSRPHIRTGAFEACRLAKVAVPTRIVMLGRMVRCRISRRARAKSAGLQQLQCRRGS